MNIMIQPTNKTTVSFLKKQNGISKYGSYVKMCYDAMVHLKAHKGYDVSEDRLYERNYIISLSYIMGKYDGENDTMSGLIVGGDVNKYVFDHCLKTAEYELEEIKETKMFLDFSDNYVAPDFLIHKNNKIRDVNEKCQKIVIEAKTKPSLKENEFYRDFFKLNVYLSRLKFRYGIYLLINTSVSQINNYIKSYIDRGLYLSKKCKNRMLFLVHEKESEIPSLYVFKLDPIEYFKTKNDAYIIS